MWFKVFPTSIQTQFCRGVLYKTCQRKPQVLLNVPLYMQRRQGRAGVGEILQDPGPVYRAGRQILRAPLHLLTYRLSWTFLKNKWKKKLGFSITVRGTFICLNGQQLLCVTYILFSSFAFLPSFATLSMGHLGTEAGYIIVALLGIPFLPTLLASKAKFLVLVLSLGIGAVKIMEKILNFLGKRQKWKTQLILITAVCMCELNPLPLLV